MQSTNHTNLKANEARWMERRVCHAEHNTTQDTQQRNAAVKAMWVVRAERKTGREIEYFEFVDPCNRSPEKFKKYT